MDDKPEGQKRGMQSQRRSSLRAEMEEIRERTEDALKRSRAIIAKSKTDRASNPAHNKDPGLDI